MAFNPLYAACIRRAAQRLGGYDALAARLKVSGALLERWASSEGGASEALFLKIVDILLEETPPPPSNPPPGDARRL
jgi:hypothetical protein